MKKTGCLFLLFLSCQLYAQKQIEKEIPLQNITSIFIDGNDVFKINIEAIVANSIHIQAKFEGENNEQLVLLSDVNETDLILSTRYQPLFKLNDDKLAAHKVKSIELTLRIPEHLQIHIKSDIAVTHLKGTFKVVNIELESGNCNLESFLGNAIISTINGSIFLNTNDAHVKANTKYGKLKQENVLKGKHAIELKSINGNITVTKIE